MIKSIILGLVRHVLTYVGGGLVTKGLMQSDDLTEAVGAIITLGGIAWSVYHKHQVDAATQTPVEVSITPSTKTARKRPVNTKGGKIVSLLFLLGFVSTMSVSAQTFRADVKPRPLQLSATETNLNDVIDSEPSVRHGLQEIIDALAVSPSNVWYTAYGLYAPGLEKKSGGGFGAFHPISDYIVAGVRIDYVDGGFWMPSGSATFQVPLKWKFIKFTPLTYAGIGVPISGAKIGSITIPGSIKDNNGQATAILGYGGAIELYSNNKLTLGLVGDVETWSGFPDKQYRFGLVTKIAF